MSEARALIALSLFCRHLRRQGGDRSARATVCPSYCTPVMLTHPRLPPHLCCVHSTYAVPRSGTASFSQHARPPPISLFLRLVNVHLSAAFYTSSFLLRSVLGTISPLMSPSCVPGPAPISAGTCCSLILASSVAARSCSVLYHRTHTSTPSGTAALSHLLRQPLSRLLLPSPALVGSRCCLLGP